MISKNENIRLSSLTNQLSQYLYEFLGEGEEKSRSLLQEMKRYIKFQVKFLVHFNYTKGNIKNHFMEKAAAFFGFELCETGEVNRRKRTRKTANRFKRKLNKRLIHRKEPQQESFFRKKKAKKTGNFYRAPA